MTASLAARRRREGEKPPMLVNKDNDGKEQKEKKKTGEGWLKESLLMMAGLVWYSIIVCIWESVICVVETQRVINSIQHLKGM